MNRKDFITRVGDRCKVFIKQTPVINTIVKNALLFVLKISFTGSKEYWEKRYSKGKNSGEGSYDKFAEFKAEIINSFVQDNQIKSVIDFGCGDGNQLSLFNFPDYIGLDVSRTAIKLCLNHFSKDTKKKFFIYDPECFHDNHSIFKAELAISLDVIYHLVEDAIFELYMAQLFASSDKFVIIYSSDVESGQSYHIKHRRFSLWVETNLPNWKLINKIQNKFPPDESCANFFIYKKENQER